MSDLISKKIFPGHWHTPSIKIFHGSVYFSNQVTILQPQLCCAACLESENQRTRNINVLYGLYVREHDSEMIGILSSIPF